MGGREFSCFNLLIGGAASRSEHFPSPNFVRHGVTPFHARVEVTLNARIDLTFFFMLGASGVCRTYICFP